MTRATWSEEADLSAARRGRLWRRVGVVVIILLVAAGAAGILGARTDSVSASAGDVTLTVEYPGVTRGGLAASWVATIRSPGGFSDPITIATTKTYLDLFDHNALYPEPAGARIDGDMIEWTFDPPAGDTLTVHLDARIEPARQSGGSARTAVLAGGREIVAVSYRTTILP